MSRTNVAVSFFRSQWGHAGKATFQVFPPRSKNVASTLIVGEEHLGHCKRIGAVSRGPISRFEATRTF